MSMYLSETNNMLSFKDIVDAIIDVTLDPLEVTLYVHHGGIFPVVDYRLDQNNLHLINFRSNDLIEDVVNLQELITYVAVEGYDLEDIVLDCKDFEIIEDRVLIY